MAESVTNWLGNHGWARLNEAAPVRPRTAVPASLSRPRLVTRLRAASKRKLTLIRGPAGSGKSTLLAEWMRLDAASGLIPLGPDLSQLWAQATTALRRHGSVTLVLDGVDFGPDEPATSIARALLAVPAVRLVLSTRTNPAVALSRWRLLGELTEVDATDLAFTRAEVVDVWRTFGLTPSDADADALYERTEGWPALVCLAALARVDGPASDDSAYEFLRTDVLGAQPATARDLLLRMSQLPAVHAELAQRLTGIPDTYPVLVRLHSDGLLERDEATNGPASEWFRPRRPILDFLRREAHLTIASELSDVRLTAARWHADHGDASTALRLAAEAEDWTYTARLVTRHAGHLLIGPDRTALRGLQLPIVDDSRDVEALAAHAVAAAGRGDVHAAGTMAAVTRSLAGEQRSEAYLKVAVALAELLVARRTEPGHEWRAAASPLAGLLDEVQVTMPGAGLIESFALSTQGWGELADGELEAAHRSLTQSIETLDTASPHIASEARTGLALLALVRGDPRRAAELAAAVPPHTVESAAPQQPCDCLEPLLREAVLDCARILLGAAPTTRYPNSATVESGGTLAVATRVRSLVASGDTAAADQLLRPHLDRTITDPPALAKQWLALAEAEVHLSAGRPVHALTAVSRMSLDRGSPLAGPGRVMSARAYLASAAPARAASLVAPIPEWPDVGPLVLVEASLVSALAAEAQGYDGTVGIALGRAGSAASPSGIIAPLLDPAVLALVDRHRDVLVRYPALARRLALHLSHLGVRHPAGALPSTRVSSARTRGSDRHASGMAAPITGREAVVLRYLPTLLTLNDIARELSVSPNTVKSHVRHIYRKLSVTSRRDAVRQARRLGLLWD